MPDKDVVFAKVAAIQKWLRRIKHVTGLDPDRLEELDTQDIRRNGRGRQRAGQGLTINESRPMPFGAAPKPFNLKVE